jgi:predicted nucleic acid-binding protein
MRHLFVDAGAWIALESLTDNYHQAARVFAQTDARQFQWVTSNWVLFETVSFLRRRANHAVAVRFMERVRSSKRLQIVRIERPHEERAWVIFKRYADKDFGFLDCTSFAVMETLGIAEAFSFDRHFRQFGFQTLPLLSH